MNRHIILTNGRSGSNNIANTLNLHAQLVNFGEVLGSWTLPRRLYELSSGIRAFSRVRPAGGITSGMNIIGAPVRSIIQEMVVG